MNYCIECLHVQIPTDEEIRKSLATLPRSERQNPPKVVYLCAEPTNLDYITKSLRPCSDVRMDETLCGRNGKKFEPKEKLSKKDKLTMADIV